MEPKMSAKWKLRQLMGDILANVSPESRARQSEMVLEKIRTHPQYKKARNVSLYLSTVHEVDTIVLLRQALQNDGKRCFVPFVPRSAKSAASGNQPRMQMIELQSMEQYENLPMNRYGIKEPDEKFAGASKRISLQEGVVPGLVIVPGVAFARDGRRLGHGKGYYDEFLHHLAANLPANKRPYTLGLALREQIVDDPLAVSGHDYQLDEVLLADA